MLDSNEIDWSGKLLGASFNIRRKVPAIPKKSKTYCLILIAIRQYEIALKPAKPAEILNLLARLKLHFASSYTTENEFQYMLTDYLADLAQYPKDLLELACVEFRKNPESQFFPKIGQLIKLIERHFYPRKLRLTKLKKLLEVSNQAMEEVNKEKQQK